MICTILAVAPLEFGNSGSGEITQILIVSPKDLLRSIMHVSNNGYFYESDPVVCYFLGSKIRIASYEIVVTHNVQSCIKDVMEKGTI